MKFFKISILLFFLYVGFLESQVKPAVKPTLDSCRKCNLPKIFKDSTIYNSNNVFDLRLKSGETLYNCLSIKRIIYSNLGRDEQGALITMIKDNNCFDTLLMASKVRNLRFSNLGVNGQPIILPFYPALMFYREQGKIGIPSSFFEIHGMLGYGGSYTNELNRNVGFSSIYWGLEALVNPFSDFLGEKMSFALGGSIMNEGGRFRIPVQGHLRWKFLSGQRLVERGDNFVPNPCKIGTLGESPINPNNEISSSETQYMEIPQNDERYDSTVYYVREKEIVTDWLRPYMFIEGGPIFNTDFDGAGNDDVINPDEYNQYFAGAGLGTYLGKYLNVALSYRFMRLNLKTKCIPCEQNWVQNTNDIHSVNLKFGLFFNW